MATNAELVEVAGQIGESSQSWADLANALFDQESGLLAREFTTREQRLAFLQSDEYRQIKELIARAKDRSGLVEGAAPTKSGRLLVRLPKSMHAALDSEAEGEGVSLNHLLVAKLAVQLAKVRESPTKDWVSTVVQAYAEVRARASEDRVIADPDWDARFLARCRQLGATDTDFQLNKKLLYARKKGFTANLPKAARFRIPREQTDRYQHAAEMALRFVQRKEMEQSLREVSLDTVICDPLLAAAFDSFAARLAPGFSPFEYRWAALALRKAGRYMKDAMAAELPRFDDLGRTSALGLGSIPEVQGLYVVRNAGETVFVSETSNLRARVQRHFDLAGPRMVPEWLYDRPTRETRLGIAVMPKVSETALKAAELRAILALTPLLNYPRAA